MLVVLSDTHARAATQLSGRTREAVRAADRVVHAGDFVTADVLDAFESVCADAGAAFEPVAGNSDRPAVCDRVPAERTVEYGGLRLAVAHGHEHTDATLPLFARAAAADCAVVGHTHRPSFGVLGDVPVLNPGSHADPRGNRAAHAELLPVGAAGSGGPGANGDAGENVGGDGNAEAGPALEGRLVTTRGETFERFRIGTR